MHSFISYIVILLFCPVLCAQQIEIIQEPNDPDSSYYDIIKIDTNEYWAAGENGILVALDSHGNSRTIDYPTVGVDILKMDRLNKDEWVLAGKEGVLYYYNRPADQWRVQRVPGFKRKVFYEIAVKNENTILIGGGMSKIADSKTALPRGFIIKSVDGGKSWRKVYSNPLAMIWDIDQVGDSLVAVMFNPFSKSRLLVSAKGEKWQTRKLPVRGLYHHLDEQSGELAGGTKMNMTGRAILSDGRQTTWAIQTPFWWSAKTIGTTLLAAGSFGTLMTGTDRKKTIQLPIQTHLYEIAPVSRTSALIVGSGQCILKIIINGPGFVSKE